MCGITGIFSFNLVGKFNKIHATAATMSLAARGPDFQDVYLDEWVALGHRHLRVIDTPSAGHQPMWDESRRYAIVCNGEIFNFRELRKDLEASGVGFVSDSDTEVLLKLFIQRGEKCLSLLNGVFAFCIYDRQEQSFFLARDRFGVKPLLYVHDEHKFIFASAMRAILEYGIEREIDHAALRTYFHLNYIPAPATVFAHVKKLPPGHYLRLKDRNISIVKYYDIPYDYHGSEDNALSYGEAKKKFRDLLDRSVQRRLVTDVPLGAFLSGGVDSSVVTALASRHKPDLHTFSIGFPDEKSADETPYARLVARHFRTEHTVFSLSNDDIAERLHEILEDMDEPFGDSSAINVYLLSRETRKHATVILSGDGADELLGGYDKHRDFYNAAHPSVAGHVVTALRPLWKILPRSRTNRYANAVRQLLRFAEGSKLPPGERWWKWAGYADEPEVNALLRSELVQSSNSGYELHKENILNGLAESHYINDILLKDTKVVLPDNTLAKVDRMSMAHSLEVRTPFLDVDVVDFLFSLPAHFKVDAHIGKKILHDTFRDMLPAELYGRPKKKLEAPLLKLLRREMRSTIENDLLSRVLIEEQGIFNYPAIAALKRRLFSYRPGDAHVRIWGVIAFQWWWKKYIQP